MNTYSVGILSFFILFLTACSPKSKTPIIIKNQTSIYGGENLNATEEVAGFIVGIYHVEQGYLCTGSLIEDNIVLTAAHCVHGDPKKIVLFFGPALEKGVEGRRVDKAAVHEAYNKNPNQKNTADIALLRFVGAAPAGYSPVELLEDPNQLKTGSDVLLAGYGLSDIRQQSGSGRLRWVINKLESPDWSATEASVMQGLDRGGVCSGDSGGPAFMLSDDRWVVWGVTSRVGSTQDGPCTKDAVFSRVDKFQSWINHHRELLLNEAGQ